MNNQAYPDHYNFPFTAVAGQESLKLALILIAVNPKIGGVLISGPRGSAKSTLARGLAGVMPTIDEEVGTSFVSLPLGATEDRLLGTLDLEQVLQDKEMRFKSGLLSQAHGGILYVDEVNLLSDNLVDQLLDVSASGINRVERDGISHEHEARFLLVGTMNPDEGELRPQLEDRFGLMVSLSNQYTLEERVQIVRLRDEYDQDPKAFCDAFKYKQRNLKNTIQAARKTLTEVRCADALRMDIASRCQEANVDGVRADIVWVRAAMAHAAWRGSKTVSVEDVQAVEELVLAHRRQQTPPMPPSSPPPSRRPPSSHSERDASEKKHPDSMDQQSHGEWGSMAPQMQNSSTPTTLAVNQAQFAKSQPVKDRTQKSGKRQGELQGGYRPNIRQEGDSVDWFRSLANQPHQWPPKSLKYKAPKTGQSVLHLILLDTSASTLSQGMFGKAKDVILDIANRAYLAREEIAILGFGQDNVSSILSRVRAPKEISQLLDNLGAGGGTPFRVAIARASQYLKQQHTLNPALLSQTYILTDGRTQADVSDLPLPGNCVLIDTENAPIKRGRGQDIADSLGADYVLLSLLLETAI